MKKMFIVVLLILSTFIYPSLAQDSAQHTASSEKKLSAESLDKIIYDAFFKYVSENTPFFQVDHGIQTKIANNNVAGVLELFFVALKNKTDRDSYYDSSARREIEALKKNEESLKEQIKALSNKVEMLTTHVSNISIVLKDNKSLQELQKFTGKR